MTPHRPTNDGRVVAVDVLRGLVILVLVPDLRGGFSFYEMAAREPDNPVWRALAHQFSHVPWQGMALWDLVMPAFVLLVGVSLALSVDRRRARGEPFSLLLGHALLRSAALFVLGLLLPMQRTTVAQELVPYAILATGLPWARWVQRWTGRVSAARDVQLELVLPAAVVLMVGGWLAMHPERLGAYDFNQILTQLGLAYLPAFLLVGRSVRGPLLAATAILALWGLAFAMYSPPPGLMAQGEVMTGWFGHWNNGTNVAAAADRWLFDVLPRSEPYHGNEHGYHTLEFVPLIAHMLIGVAVGRWLTLRPPGSAWRLALAGLAGLAGGAVLALTLFPLVKSLWTPSWAIVSAALCVIALAILTQMLKRPALAPVATALTCLGTNALLLYVIASVHRWRIVLYGERLVGTLLTEAPMRPLLQSLLVLVALWGFACWLDRRHIHLRL